MSDIQELVRTHLEHPHPVLEARCARAERLLAMLLGEFEVCDHKRLQHIEESRAKGEELTLVRRSLESCYRFADEPGPWLERFMDAIERDQRQLAEATAKIAELETALQEKRL